MILKKKIIMVLTVFLMMVLIVEVGFLLNINIGQSNAISKNLGSIQFSLEQLNVGLSDMKWAVYKNNSEINTLQRRLRRLAPNIKRFSAYLNDLKKESEDWKKDYVNALVDLSERYSLLSAKIAELQKIEDVPPVTAPQY